MILLPVSGGCDRVPRGENAAIRSHFSAGAAADTFSVSIPLFLRVTEWSFYFRFAHHARPFCWVDSPLMQVGSGFGISSMQFLFHFCTYLVPQCMVTRNAFGYETSSSDCGVRTHSSTIGRSEFFRGKKTVKTDFAFANPAGLKCIESGRAGLAERRCV